MYGHGYTDLTLYVFLSLIWELRLFIYKFHKVGQDRVPMNAYELHRLWITRYLLIHKASADVILRVTPSSGRPEMHGHGKRWDRAVHVTFAEWNSWTEGGTAVVRVADAWDEWGVLEMRFEELMSGFMIFLVFFGAISCEKVKISTLLLFASDFIVLMANINVV